MKSSRVLILALLGVCAIEAAAAPEGDDDAPPDRAAAVAAAFAPLPERMVKGQLAKCRGVEVHRRGDGFIAGRVEGPIVLLRASVGCTEGRSRDDQPEAMIHASWWARFPDSDDEIEVFRTTIDPVRLLCPTEIRADVLRALQTPPPEVCEKTFTRPFEDFGLVDFFGPVLVPTGAPRLGTVDGRPSLRFERGGRELELSGRVRCRNTVEQSALVGTGMGPRVLVIDVRLVDAVSRRVIGQWNEEVLREPATSCDLAFRRPSSPRRIEAARATWATRIEDAIAQGL